MWVNPLLRCMMCRQVGLLAQVFALHVELGENDVARLLESREDACSWRKTGQAAEIWDFVRCTGPASELKAEKLCSLGLRSKQQLCVQVGFAFNRIESALSYLVNHLARFSGLAAQTERLDALFAGVCRSLALPWTLVAQCDACHWLAHPRRLTCV